MILDSPKQLKVKPQRILSLVPSQTELLHYLGLDQTVIGITKFCIHPAAWKRSKKIIGGTKNINIKLATECEPDLIIANKEENTKEQIELLAKSFNVWLTDVNNLSDAMQMITDIGLLTLTNEKATALNAAIRAGFSQLKKTTTELSVCYLIWRDPYMTTGGDCFINDMLQQCGFENIFKNEKRYPEISIDVLNNLHCDLLFLSTEPYPFSQQHIDELHGLLPNTKILLADGEMFSWYGSRLQYAPGYFQQLINSI